jgi:hypothetical protein
VLVVVELVARAMANRGPCTSSDIHHERRACRSTTTTTPITIRVATLLRPLSISSSLRKSPGNISELSRFHSAISTSPTMAENYQVLEELGSTSHTCSITHIY